MSVRVNCPYGCGGVMGHDESPSCPVDWIIGAATRVSANADVPFTVHFREALHDLDSALAAHDRAMSGETPAPRAMPDDRDRRTP